MNCSLPHNNGTKNAQEGINAISSLLIVLPPHASSGPIEPRTELLGLPLASRKVLSAERAGFERVVTLPEESIKTIVAQRIVVLSGDILPDSKWLHELLHMPVKPETMTFEHGIAAVIETSHSQKMFLLKPPSEDEAGDIFSIMSKIFDAAPRQLSENKWLNITPETTVSAAEDWLLSCLVKDTDGFMARLISRPISLTLTKRLAATSVSANTVTVISTLVGLLGAPFFLSSEPKLQVTGALLFLAHSILDGCDGELARLRMRETRFGGTLDYWCDNLVHVAIFSCMALGWSLKAESAWPLIAGGAAITGTLASAGFVFWRTMRHKKTPGPLFTSVAQASNSGFSKIANALARRDFVYLVVLLSVFGMAAWFLTLTAVGAPLFFLLLLLIAYQDTNLEKIGTHG